MNGYVGKTLKNEKEEEYLILNELEYKGIACVYGMKVMPNNEEGEKAFFQLSSDSSISLVTITSKKMISALSHLLFEENKGDDEPRKIMDNESIPDYLAYLDEFYKGKVVTIM